MKKINNRNIEDLVNKYSKANNLSQISKTFGVETSDLSKEQYELLEFQLRLLVSLNLLIQNPNCSIKGETYSVTPLFNDVVRSGGWLKFDRGNKIKRVKRIIVATGGIIIFLLTILDYFDLKICSKSNQPTQNEIINSEH
ncbi:MAG: hypothetical protein KBE91_07805 [Bacteroidia bacterium]|nr:hypothetical protein [Bacteroidia bacterium]